MLSASGLVALPAEAQTKPRFVVAVDTSGSMGWDLGGRPTYGDGVGRVATGSDNQALVRDGVFYGCGTTAGLDRNCDGFPNDSRMSIAKDAIRKMVLGFGDVEWSLSKFAQPHALNTSTRRYTNSNACDVQAFGNPQCNSGTEQTGCVSTLPDACEPGLGTNPRLRTWSDNGTNPDDFSASINYGSPGCGATSPADLLVGFSGISSTPFATIDNRPAILRWMDNVETGFDSSKTVGNMCNAATGGDCELRPNGNTPLGSLISTSGNYALTTRMNDASSACRPYSVILVTDGAESCSTNPNSAAFQLAWPGMGTACPTTLPTATPTVKTYVVGISITSSDTASLNAIAACGGTTSAYFASSPAQLSAALSDIVSKSILSETCNGRDDDCDTRVDEGIPLGQPGNTAQPQALFCDREGRRSPGQNTQVQTRPDVSDTLPQTTPITQSYVCGRVPDTCSNPNQDDDCDGALDEDATNKTTCGTCPGQPDVCDGIDNDCDTVTDETAGTGRPFSACPITCQNPVPCGSDIGECNPGVYRCTGGVLDTSECFGQTFPTLEVCDLKDNDCDGIVDNPGALARKCTTPWGDVGRCATGTQFCAKMGEAAVDGFHVDAMGQPVCENRVNPADREICDGLDDDCDGSLFTCTSSTCVVGPNPVGVGNACGMGSGSCMGHLVCNMNSDPPSLVCDAAGSTGTVETCDGLDNDCDGAIDEGLGQQGPCGSSVGECRPGNYLCDPGGTTVCVGSIDPVPETCDALDDDCDGKVDEELGLGEDCGNSEGTCSTGKLTCLSGRVICSGEILPQAETCDCEDNDCDGMIDETAGDSPICPGQSACTMCQCALPCAESEEFVSQCPQGKAAVQENDACFCVGELCNEARCAAQTIKLDDVVQCQPNSDAIGSCSCRNNECVFPCSGVVCQNGLVCDPTDGRCRQSSCLLPQFKCPSNQRCSLVDQVFQCVDDPCAFQTCNDDQFCRDGNCFGSCANVTCDSGERCVDGECVEDRCASVTCEGSLLCNPENRSCVEGGACTRNGCPDGQTCDAVVGACSEDACLKTQCPAGQLCVSGTGQCERRCATDLVYCDGQCINPSSNRRYCGATGSCSGDGAGERCGSNLVCSVGQCSSNCAEGLVNCGGDCIDPTSDAAHCGASGDCSGDAEGLKCNSDETCTDGECRTDAVVAPPTKDTTGHGLVAAGGGGCACSVGPGSARGSAPASGRLAFGGLVLLLAAALRRRRRARALWVRLKAARASVLLLGMIASAPVESGCKLNTFCLDCPTPDSGMNTRRDAGGGQVNADGGGQTAPDATVNGDGGASDLDAAPSLDASGSQPDACSATELCNGIDDDCDGTVDENADPAANDIDIQTDALHCGGCGKACAIEHAFNACVDGNCVIDGSRGEGGCDIGFFDRDGDAANGCEFRCNKTAEDDSACNLVDDDCDDKIDEDVDPMTDSDNCGSCGLRCQFVHAAEGATCVDRACVLDDSKCDTGFRNIDDKPTTGCEYGCPVVPPVGESCNGLDDDCDSKIDENVSPTDDSRIGVACGSMVGECRQGTTACVMGAPACTGGITATAETCDAKDNDCDMNMDEGFDLVTDVANCGVCSNACRFNVPDGHGTLICTGGTCRVGACFLGYTNADSDYLDGCETSCIPTGNDYCDGIDNDCDGMIDNNVVVPAQVCSQRVTGVCAVGAAAMTVRTRAPQCTNATLSCNLNNVVGMIPDFELVETSCDDKDNDCDGRIDESIPQIGRPCTAGNGVCQRSGVFRCNGPSSFECSVVANGAASTDEACDGVDNDCDTRVDEFATPTGNTVTGFQVVNLGAPSNALIMAYEATKPDATASNAGRLTNKPCSVPNRMPWADVTWGEADAACCALNADGMCQTNNKGWRLCDASTWQTACDGPAGTCTWGYSNAGSAPCAHDARVSTYANVCRGAENTSWSCGTGVSQCAGITGSTSNAQCFADLSNGDVFDLSGNLKEWTRTSAGTNIYQLRGGSYNNVEGGRACDFDFTVGNTSFRFPNTGFRCCYYP